LGEVVFSKSFRIQQRDTNRTFPGLSMDALRGLNTVGFIPLLMNTKLPTLFFSEVNDGMMKYKDYCAEQSDERIARLGELQKPDIWTRIADGKDPISGHSFTREGLRSEANPGVSRLAPDAHYRQCLAHYLLDRRN
jgi:hypothetical protein